MSCNSDLWENSSYSVMRVGGFVNYHIIDA